MKAPVMTSGTFQQGVTSTQPCGRPDTKLSVVGFLVMSFAVLEHYIPSPSSAHCVG